MKKLFLKLTFVVGIAPFLNVEAQQENDLIKNQQYQLLYQDEFNVKGKPAVKEWFFRINAKLGGQSIKSNVTQDKSTDGTNQSCLLIKYTSDKNQKEGEQFLGGGIVSTHNFGYGYYEARVKLYGGSKELSGLHQSFWSMGLTGTNEAEGKGIRDSLVSIDAIPAENRVLEIDGFEQNSIDNKLAQNHHVYSPKHLNKHPKSPYYVKMDLSKWVVMGYEWLPDRINFYCNGEYISTKELNGVWNLYAPQNVWFTALPVSKPEWGWGGLEMPAKDAAMQVDYFRFYAKNLSGVNRIGNAGFEYFIPGSSYPVAWIVAQTNGNISEAVKVIADSTETNNGLRFLIHKLDKPYKAISKQILEYIPNGKYSFEAYIKSSGGQRKSEIMVKASDKSYVYDIKVSSLWTKIILNDIEVKNNMATIEIISDADTNQWLMVDDVNFKQQN